MAKQYGSHTAQVAALSCSSAITAAAPLPSPLTGTRWGAGKQRRATAARISAGCGRAARLALARAGAAVAAAAGPGGQGGALLALPWASHPAPTSCRGARHGWEGARTTACTLSVMREQQRLPAQPLALPPCGPPRGPASSPATHTAGRAWAGLALKGCTRQLTCPSPSPRPPHPHPRIPHPPPPAAAAAGQLPAGGVGQCRAAGHACCARGGGAACWGVVDVQHLVCALRPASTRTPPPLRPPPPPPLPYLCRLPALAPARPRLARLLHLRWTRTVLWGPRFGR